MPSKKNPPPNGFFFFMQSLRPDLKSEGIVVTNNRELAELAGPRWAALSPEEREPFNAQAKREKQNRRYGPQPDKMDCTGQYISMEENDEIMDDFQEEDVEHVGVGKVLNFLKSRNVRASVISRFRTEK
ncbi:Hypothetical predicted protein, partial [Paramuricea clavata]